MTTRPRRSTRRIVTAALLSLVLTSLAYAPGQAGDPITAAARTVTTTAAATARTGPSWARLAP